MKTISIGCISLFSIFLMYFNNNHKIDRFKFKQDLKNIVVIDSFNNSFSEANFKDIQTGIYEIFYFGKKVDTIFLPMNRLSEKYKRRIFYNHRNNLITNELIKFIVDTSKIVSSIPFQNFTSDKNNLDSFERSNINNFKSYPTYIQNISEDSLFLSLGNLNIIMQAKDSTNRWIPIEKPEIIKCGFGLPINYLAKNEIVMFGCRIYSGTFRTKFRLKMGKSIYSNEFWGNINYDQFWKKDWLNSPELKIYCD